PPARSSPTTKPAPKRSSPPAASRAPRSSPAAPSGSGLTGRRGGGGRLTRILVARLTKTVREWPHEPASSRSVRLHPRGPAVVLQDPHRRDFRPRPAPALRRDVPRRYLRHAGAVC